MVCVVPETCGVQLPPPSAVFRIRPLYPTIQPALPTKAMSISFSSVPDFTAFQVLPPSAVARIRPSSPTTKPRFTSRNAIARRADLAPVSLADQVPPLSALTHTEPCSHNP